MQLHYTHRVSFLYLISPQASKEMKMAVFWPVVPCSLIAVLKETGSTSETLGEVLPHYTVQQARRLPLLYSQQ
jgi:hypothetical protein